MRALTKGNEINQQHYYYCLQELSNLIILSRIGLLDFAADFLPTTTAFFLIYQATYLLVLETLNKCAKDPICLADAANYECNTQFFYTACHHRGIRKLCKKYCKKVFKEEIGIDKFAMFCCRDKNLKESPQKSTNSDYSSNESVNAFFENLNENQ